MGKAERAGLLSAAAAAAAWLLSVKERGEEEEVSLCVTTDTALISPHDASLFPRPLDGGVVCERASPALESFSFIFCRLLAMTLVSDRDFARACDEDVGSD